MKAQKYDVLVAGSGPAGIAAAIAAARRGRSTALLERYGCLGGGMTSSFVRPFLGSVANETIGKEIERRIRDAESFCSPVDAPTERGVKHIRELIKAKAEGYRAVLAFVIQMDGVTEVRANAETHPAFADAMDEAKRAGARILFLPCHVEPDGIRAISQQAL